MPLKRANLPPKQGIVGRVFDGSLNQQTKRRVSQQPKAAARTVKMPLIDGAFQSLNAADKKYASGFSGTEQQRS
jgi:hypothetical protein